ncbi:MAG TPA: DUF3379 family protein [Steroidobacteraceae bacterium]
MRFESRLDRALRVNLPAPLCAATSVDAPVPMAGPEPAPAPPKAPFSDNVVPLRRKSSRSGSGPKVYHRGWLAVAASVLLGTVVAGVLWLGVPGPSLAADVVTHMAEEPEAWRRTDVPVPEADLQQILRDSHFRLGPGAGMVSYANSCLFRGHRVPHLVIQTASGPVTVMVLVHEAAPKPKHFDEHGYRGVIVPVPGHGSLAVLTRGGTTDLSTIHRIAARVLASIVWTA